MAHTHTHTHTHNNAAAQGQAGGAGRASAAAAPTGPVLAVGDHVVLAPGSTRTSDGSRGPLRRGDVGVVLEVGESHVCVRALASSSAHAGAGSAAPGAIMLPGGIGIPLGPSGVLGLGASLGVSVAGIPGVRASTGNRPWWYANSSLAIAPAGDAAAAAAAAAAEHAETPAVDCENLAAPFKDTSATVAAVRRLVSRVAGEGTSKTEREAALLEYCDGHGLIEALAEGLRMCCRPGTQGQTSSGSSACLDSLLLAANIVASVLFVDTDATSLDKETPTVGDVVTFKMDPLSDKTSEGVVTDDLGFGRLCVYSTLTRASYDVDRSTARLNKRQQAAPGAEGRVASGVMSYLNQLLTSRAVPLGDLSIVQRVLADGAEIEHTDGDGNTPLLLSIDRGGSLDLVTVLLQNGASVNAENLAGRSPLAAAVDKDRGTLVQRLLAQGADPDKVGEEALTKCSAEIRQMIEEKRAAAEQASADTRAASDAQVAGAAARTKQQQTCLTRLLPALLRTHAAAPAGMASQAERSLAYVVLLMLERCQCVDGAEEMRALLNGADIAGPALAVAEDMAISQTPYDVLLAFRLVQAVLKADIAHGALLGRYYVMSAMQDMAQEKGLMYETLALQPPIAVVLAQQPAAVLLAKVLPSTEASASGVSLLARKLLAMLGPAPDPSPTGGGKGVAQGWDASLTTRLAGGDTSALEQLRDMMLKHEALTSREVQEMGILEAIIAFVEPPHADVRARRTAQFWKTMSEAPVSTDNDNVALWSLVRRLQKVRHACSPQFTCMRAPQSTRQSGLWF